MGISVVARILPEQFRYCLLQDAILFIEFLACSEYAVWYRLVHCVS
jgi:hypothetical protein